MPSQALIAWNSSVERDLDRLDAMIKGQPKTAAASPARQQLMRANVLLLSSHFQGFCRDLHTEAASRLSNAVQPTELQRVVNTRFVTGRKLDSGNPNPQISAHQQNLDALNTWRNAIAHHDFTKVAGRTSLVLSEVRAWRRSCDVLAGSFDDAVRAYVNQFLGVAGQSPWR